MTCIVGYLDKKNKRSFVGGDSAGVAGLDITIRKDVKVFKVDNFVIGCTSSFRMIKLLRFSFNPPKIKKKDVFEYMCTDFIDAVRECFKKGGFLQKYTEGDEKGGTFIVAYKDRLFEIDDDFQVAENLNGVSAVGCGKNYALGAIHPLQEKDEDPEKIVLAALSAAEFYSGGVSSPFIIEKT